MKAKEYYETYCDVLMNPSRNLPLRSVVAVKHYPLWDQATVEQAQMDVYDVFRAFLKEMKPIMDTRHARTMQAFNTVAREQNQKWNALCALFVKKHGKSPLKKDYFEQEYDNLKKQFMSEIKAERGTV